MYLRRGDPLRIAVLVVLIGSAAAWAWSRADDGSTDLLRFVAGTGAGLVLAGLARTADGGLARRVPFGRREEIAGIAVIAVAAMAPIVLLVGRGLDLEDLDVALLGAAAGFLAGVGALYPIES